MQGFSGVISRIILALIVLVISASACLPPVRDIYVPGSSLRITADDISVTGEFAARTASITIQNETQDMVKPLILRIAGEEAILGILADLETGLLSASGKAIYTGGARIPAGEARKLTFDMKPGFYLAVLPGEAPLKYTTFNVPETNPSRAPAAAGFISIDYDDISMRIKPASLSSGSYTWEISPASQNLCELNLIQLDDPASIDDVKQFLAGGETTPPSDFRIVEAVGPLSAGQKLWIQLNLEPGRYLAACTSHASKGEIVFVEFSVK